MGRGGRLCDNNRPSLPSVSRPRCLFRLCLFITSSSLQAWFPLSSRCLPLDIVSAFCLSLRIPFVSFIDQPFTTINRRISQMVWMLRPIFHDISSGAGDGLRGSSLSIMCLESVFLFRTRELMQADGKCLHAY